LGGKVDKSILGKMVKDKVTGFKGIAVAIAFYLNGCVRVSIQPRKLKDKDGGTVDEEWIDDTQLKIIAGGLDEVEEEKKVVGGPRSKYSP